MMLKKSQTYLTKSKPFIRKIISSLLGLLILCSIASIGLFIWCNQGINQANQRETVIINPERITKKYPNYDYLSYYETESGAKIQVFTPTNTINTNTTANLPTILLQHGTGALGDIWYQTIHFLVKQGFQVVSLDMPPFGYSIKKTGKHDYQLSRQAQRFTMILNDLKEKQQMTSLVIVAHSVGSQPVLMAVQQQITQLKSWIQKIILIDPALGLPFQKKDTDSIISKAKENITCGILNNTPSVLAQGLSSHLGTNPNKVKKNFQSFVFQKSAVSPTMEQMIKNTLNIKHTNEAYSNWFVDLMCPQSSSERFFPEHLKRIQQQIQISKWNIPVDFIWGFQDDITPLWQGKWLQQQIFKTAPLIVIDDVGHIPYLENPNRFHQELLKSLKPLKPLNLLPKTN